MLPLLVLRHAAVEGPGLLAEVARSRGVDLQIADMPAEFPRWPEPTQYQAVLVLGGPMSVYDNQRFPWLKDEARLLRRCMDEGIPILGICLGAQLLAFACGSRVTPGRRPEIGWGEVNFTPASRTDPLFAGLPDRLTVFHWHGDTFDLPNRSRLLATSPLYNHQAFRFEDRYYGVQFHLETTAGEPEAWAKEYQAELARTGGPTLDDGFDRSDEKAARLRPYAERVFNNWLDLLERL